MRKFNTSDFIDPMSLEVWTNERHAVHCVSVTPETHDVKTFSFQMQKTALFLFKPGQFLTLEVEIQGERIMRSYTISSTPSRPYSFSITVKRVPGGLVSNWLHDTLRPGSEITVRGPMGLFNCIDHPAKKVLLLSGGVGITPVMSMARWWLDTKANIDIVFVHSARTPKDIIYAQELQDLSARHENFTLHIIAASDEPGYGWAGYRGYLHDAMLRFIAPDYLEREIFCCGPDAYMNAVRELLHTNAFDMNNYHEESFGSPPSVEGTPSAPTCNDTDTNTIQTDEICISIPEINSSKQVTKGLSLLQAAAHAGLNIPKACGMGLCGTCRVKVLNGDDFEMSHSGGITEEEVAQGYVLSCCTKLYGNIEIAL